MLDLATPGRSVKRSWSVGLSLWLNLAWAQALADEVDDLGKSSSLRIREWVVPVRPRDVCTYAKTEGLAIANGGKRCKSNVKNDRYINCSQLIDQPFAEHPSQSVYLC